MIQPVNASSIVMFYTQPVNNSPNVVIANIVINAAVVVKPDTSQYDAYIRTILNQGYWDGNGNFIPARMITLFQVS